MRDWLYKSRLKKGLTLKQMGDALDISESYYHLIETAKRQKKMDITLAAKLSKVLDLPLAQIIAEEQRDSA